MSEENEEEKTDEEQLIEDILDAVGEYVKEHSPISPECEEVIKEGPPCTNGRELFKGQRRYVMCHAWDQLERGLTKSLGDGIRSGWDEVDETCGFSPEAEGGKKIPSVETYFPREKCDPRSFRTDVFIKPSDELPAHKVRLVYCCPAGSYDVEKKECKTAMKLHSLWREEVK